MFLPRWFADQSKGTRGGCGRDCADRQKPDGDKPRSCRIALPEVLSYRAERDGLRVRFTSMSPVCITYLVKQPAEVTVTIPAANPTTGAGSPMPSMAALCGGALVVLLAVKKKER